MLPTLKEMADEEEKFTESQVVALHKEGEAGVPVAKACRKHRISPPTY
jgi:putative transposase